MSINNENFIIEIETNSFYEFSSYESKAFSIKTTEPDGYKKFLDSFDGKNDAFFFKKFQENYDEFKIVQDISFNSVQFFSFLNFVRYQLYLKKYLRKLKFYSNWNQGILSITFESKNTTSANFQLIFLSNGLIRFLSLDRDHDNEETLSYVIDGTFSSSSIISKSHKIKRLMGILVEILNENNTINHMNDTQIIQNLNHQEGKINVMEY